MLASDFEFWNIYMSLHKETRWGWNPNLNMKITYIANACMHYITAWGDSRKHC